MEDLAIYSREMPAEVAGAGVTAAELNEADLVAQARARSPEAWTHIYDSHYCAIFRYVRARVFDEAEAEDLASAVFVGALKGIDSYHYRGRPLLAWLYRIARNVVASHQRQLLKARGGDAKGGLGQAQRVIWHLTRWGRRNDEQPTDDDLMSAASGETDPAMMVDGLDLRGALTKLPAGQREVVILRFLVGLSAQEVADVIGKKPAAVYSLQARAILTLRGQLE